MTKQKRPTIGLTEKNYQLLKIIHNYFDKENAIAIDRADYPNKRRIHLTSMNDAIFQCLTEWRKKLSMEELSKLNTSGRFLYDKDFQDFFP